MDSGILRSGLGLGSPGRRRAAMRRSLEILVFSALGVICVFSQLMANPPERFRAIIWIQPAWGMSVGDDRVSGQMDANVGISDIPLVGTLGATLPVRAEVTFEDPPGVVVGGELSITHFGLEVNVIYLPEAATARGGVQVCGGLLTEAECTTLREGSVLVPGIRVPDLMVVEKALGNLAVTVGANFHLDPDRRWDLWAGPMVVWSVWDQYDYSDVQIDVSTSLESLLTGDVDHFDLAGSSTVAPQNTLTFGASAGGRYDFAGRWSLLGQFRYFVGDDLHLPAGGGTYRAAGFSAGLARRFGG
jgi:hypothetical protein